MTLQAGDMKTIEYLPVSFQRGWKQSFIFGISYRPFFMILYFSCKAYSKTKAIHNTSWEYENGGFSSENPSNVSRPRYAGETFNHQSLCSGKTRAGKSRDYCDVIVFEKLCFHDELRGWVVAASPKFSCVVWTLRIIKWNYREADGDFLWQHRMWNSDSIFNISLNSNLLND